jgi:hypothetical protein
VVTADEEVCILKEPCMMLDENSRWVGFVGQGVGCRIKTRSGREKHNEWFIRKLWKRKREVLYSKRIVRLLELFGK